MTNPISAYICRKLSKRHFHTWCWGPAGSRPSIFWNAIENQGPMLWFFKYFRRKFCKKLAFLTQNKAKFWKKLIITLVFEKNANFFAENWEKSQKIMIITSTPGVEFSHIFSKFRGWLVSVMILLNFRPKYITNVVIFTQNIFAILSQVYTSKIDSMRLT
jgi:hypothetical protein